MGWSGSDEQERVCRCGDRGSWGARAVHAVGCTKLDRIWYLAAILRPSCGSLTRLKDGLERLRRAGTGAPLRRSWLMGSQGSPCRRLRQILMYVRRTGTAAGACMRGDRQRRAPGKYRAGGSCKRPVLAARTHAQHTCPAPVPASFELQSKKLLIPHLQKRSARASCGI